ncbi:hydrogen peroxide-inducible genes activator [Roseixanthobacter liquoris]|uniref:hydrogen peroxide-inducible genes activator n=1 Tax=Roseixanthobacter liquoris TaxID=3119921 RepID=UPI00372A548B
MRPIPPLRQLRYLVALADHLHFGHAAIACAVTQSTLSAGIRELEVLLRVPVAERTKRSVIITATGHRIVERARLLLREAEALMDVAASAADPMSGLVEVGVIPTISPFLLPRLVPYISSHYPQMRLTLREDKTLSLLDWLNAGRLDLVLMAFPYETEGCETFMLFDDAYRFACAGDHRLARADHVSMDTIEGEALMLLEREQCLHSHALPIFQSAPEKTITSFSATSLHTLVAMVAEGLGTTLLPDLAINGGILNGSSVVVRPLLDTANARTIGLIWRKQSARADTFRRLGTLIREWAEANVRPWRPQIPPPRPANGEKKGSRTRT